MDILNVLNDTEKSQLLEAIPAITVLIAGADGEIDQDEKDWAAKITNIRSFANNELLHDFYEAVGNDFESSLNAVLDAAPKTTDQRTEFLSEKLSSLNPILAKLDPKVGHLLYKDFVSFAKHVARASGGFLRIGAISSAEKKLIPLSMLHAIEYSDEEE